MPSSKVMGSIPDVQTRPSTRCGSNRFPPRTTETGWNVLWVQTTTRERLSPLAPQRCPPPQHHQGTGRQTGQDRETDRTGQGDRQDRETDRTGQDRGDGKDRGDRQDREKDSVVRETGREDSQAVREEGRQAGREGRQLAGQCGHMVSLRDRTIQGSS